MRSFFFHYNKPASLKEGRAIISVHYRNQCFLVYNVVCNVPTKGRIKNISPKFVMTGRATSINIKDNVAYIG